MQIMIRMEWGWDGRAIGIASGTCGLGFAITVHPMVQDHRCTIIPEWSS
jgi:hypothetical protein